MMKTATHRRDERGYVMVIVLLILAVLLSAGLFSIKTLESDLRASNHMKKSELLARAAEAGAAHRVAQIALAKDDAGAALLNGDTITLPTGGTAVGINWTGWPLNGTFSTINAALDPVELTTQYQVVSVPLVTIESRPPAGVELGSGGQSTVWEITSYAVPRNAAGDTDITGGGEHSVSMGVRLWSQGGTSYNR